MRTARKITLLALTTLAAMALTTAHALATGPVEVDDEVTGAPCNPCVFHMEGESNINALPSGVEVLTCHDEFEGNIYHDGTGELEWVGGFHGAGGCTPKNCEVTPGERHWPIHSTEEAGPNVADMHVEFCLSPINAPTTELMCEADASVTEPTQHNYQLSTHTICAGGTREYEGRWNIEASPPHQAIEITHL